jgi:hypothetical protein
VGSGPNHVRLTKLCSFVAQDPAELRKFIDNETTPPGDLNPPHRPEHIDQRLRHHGSFAVTLRGKAAQRPVGKLRPDVRTGASVAACTVPDFDAIGLARHSLAAGRRWSQDV